MTELTRKSAATSFVERLLRIPPEPEPPAGTETSIRVFRAAPGFYRYRLFQWAAKQAGAVAGLLFGLLFLATIPDFPFKWTLDALEALGILSYLATVPFTYLMVHLEYQLRWYVVTDRSLRIREGIVRVDEKTMSFANIQNIAIRQGPIQRLLGIADVEVRTAGGGSSDPGHPESSRTNMHLGYFRGVENAEEIRDAILIRVKQLRDSGIGDPDADGRLSVPPVRVDAEAVAAARELCDEARALRASLA